MKLLAARIGLIFLFVGCLAVSAHADVQLNVDSAPNVFGSSNWAPWWTQTKTDIVAGTFTDMRTGTYPGTHYMDPYDEIVYSTGDLGKRLHWIYWVPGATTSGLQNLFEVKWVIDWEGKAWTLVGGSWAQDGPEVGWVQPSSWENYDNGQGTTGVIGSFGFAWWATDDDAKPYDTGGSPYDETDQADIDALRNVVLQAQTYATGYVRIRESQTGPWQETSIRVSIIPAPPAVVLGAIGLGLVGLMRRRLRR